MGEFDRRTAVVTGAGRGIGRAIALALARDGANVVVSSRTQSELDAVVAQAEQHGVQALAVVADAMDSEQCRSVVRRAIDRFGTLDVLIHNVGGMVTKNGPADHDPFHHDDDVFADNLTLNLSSAYWTVSEALPHMRDNGYGRIVTVGSGASKGITPSPLSYHAAKHGLVGLTLAFAAAAAPHGITVNCLCPGPTETGLMALGHELALALAPDDQHAATDAVPPNLLQRNLAPDEITPMALLLASHRAAGITGQVISVDGGYKV